MQIMSHTAGKIRSTARDIMERKKVAANYDEFATYANNKGRGQKFVNWIESTQLDGINTNLCTDY